MWPDTAAWCAAPQPVTTCESTAPAMLAPAWWSTFKISVWPNLAACTTAPSSLHPLRHKNAAQSVSPRRAATWRSGTALWLHFVSMCKSTSPERPPTTATNMSRSAPSLGQAPQPRHRSAKRRSLRRSAMGRSGIAKKCASASVNSPNGGDVNPSVRLLEIAFASKWSVSSAPSGSRTRKNGSRTRHKMARRSLPQEALASSGVRSAMESAICSTSVESSTTRPSSLMYAKSFWKSSVRFIS
mmetsp:Transcript_59959/g.183243  ORF Transcript_59959/g.183243 Transcript_59959/m.183243 type:complete len:242 (-) Transcript_59959:328-1053(-)